MTAFYQQNYNQKNQSAFTLVEVIVVIGIITAFLLVLLSDFPKVRLQFSLSRVSYKLQQDLRRAQTMSLSQPQYNGQDVAGYGVYVDQQNNKQYIIYADYTDPWTPGNHVYDGQDYIVETVDFSENEKGIVVKEVNPIASSYVSVNFSPPTPATTITPQPGAGSVDVVFAFESDTDITKTVSVNSAGLIEVK